MVSSCRWRPFDSCTGAAFLEASDLDRMHLERANFCSVALSRRALVSQAIPFGPSLECRVSSDQQGLVTVQACFLEVTSQVGSQVDRWTPVQALAG